MAYLGWQQARRAREPVHRQPLLPPLLRPLLLPLRQLLLWRRLLLGQSQQRGQGPGRRVACQGQTREAERVPLLPPPHLLRLEQGLHLPRAHLVLGKPQRW